MRRQQRQRLLVAAGFERVIAVVAQDPRDYLEHRGLVVDHQDGRGGARRSHRRRALGRDVGRGQVDVDGGTPALLGVDGDAAAGLGDDAVDGGKSQAGALARRPGGEEGLEGTGHRLRVHAAAGVADGEFRAQPRPGPGPHRAGGFAEVGRPGGERQDAPFRHRVAGVQGQVDQHLLDLPAVSKHRRQVRRRDEPQFDVRADAGLQHITHARQDRVQVDPLGPGGLPAAEQQKFPGQPGRAPGGGLDLLDVGSEQGVTGGRLGRRRRVPHDRAEQAAEFSGHPAGHPDRGLDPGGFLPSGLGRPLLGFGPVTLGDIPHNPGRPDDGAAFPADGGDRNRHVDDAAVLAYPLGFEVMHLPPPAYLRQDRLKLLGTVRRVKHRYVTAGHLLGGIAENGLRSGIPARYDPVQGHARDGVDGRFHDGRQQ